MSDNDTLAKAERVFGDLVDLVGDQRHTIESQRAEIADLEQDIAFLQSCVNSGEAAKLSDRPSQRTKHTATAGDDGK